MKQLYRLTYQRNGSVCGVTFSAADLVEALEFEGILSRLLGVEVLTMKPLGQSRFVARAGRVQLREEGLTNEEQFHLNISEA